MITIDETEILDNNKSSDTGVKARSRQEQIHPLNWSFQSSEKHCNLENENFVLSKKKANFDRICARHKSVSKSLRQTNKMLPLYVYIHRTAQVNFGMRPLKDFFDE